MNIKVSFRIDWFYLLAVQGTLKSNNKMFLFCIYIGKDSDAGRNWGQEEKGMTEDEMAGWYHGLNGRESE